MSSTPLKVGDKVKFIGKGCSNEAHYLDIVIGKTYTVRNATDDSMVPCTDCFIQQSSNSMQSIHLLGDDITPNFSYCSIELRKTSKSKKKCSRTGLRTITNKEW